jgi:antitoxin (DNA-binding transcriptional repressor) of toxin-antitoxin stability system
MSGPAVLEISVSAFKAKCLQIFKDLEAHRLEKVVITRRGKPVAHLATSAERIPSPYGCLAGRAIIPPDLDLTEPIFEGVMEAETGDSFP